MVTNQEKILKRLKMKGYSKEWLKFGITWFKPQIETEAFRARLRSIRFSN